MKFNSHEKFWEPINEEDGAKKYVTKYATKTEQKTVPPNFKMVGRFWGCSRDIPSNGGQFVAASESKIRFLLAMRGVKQDTWEFLPKFIWFNR